MLKSYKELTVWIRSIELVESVYHTTANFPKQEQYGLASQMKRSAVSIPSNIAEGYKRKGTAQYLQFLSYAEGSAAELETQLVISKRLLKEINLEKCESLLTEIQKMLVVLIRNLSAGTNSTNPNTPSLIPKS